jgi:hypothetical protein
MNFSVIPCDASVYEVDNSNLMKVKITIMHDGINDNGSRFALEDMKRVEDSVKNIPILGYVLRDSNGEIEDFDSHNLEIRTKQSDEGYEIETYYLEKPIGVIPENCNIRYENIEGLNYLTVDGYIWKCYSNAAYKLIENNLFKQVSMEIDILDGEFNESDNVYDVKDYRYLGVTVLGNHCEGAMGENCKIERYAKVDDYKELLGDIYKEICMIEEREHEKSEVFKEVFNEFKEVFDFIGEEEFTSIEEMICFIKEEFMKVKCEIEDYACKQINLENENRELKSYKEEVESKKRKEDVQDIIDKYGLEIDEELLKKALDAEIDIVDFEKEIKVMYADKMLESNKFSKEVEDEHTKIKVDSKYEKVVYGGLFEKHGIE